ncbi:hypothetical protein C8R46DRAFT_1049555 [Mycena filopes]|nr:hypothetical protein C8R46DRAFT_1049555 [Mycena filopes]
MSPTASTSKLTKAIEERRAMRLGRRELAAYSARPTVSFATGGGAGSSSATALLRLRRGRLLAVGPRWPLARMSGKAGAKDRERVKPQRSRRGVRWEGERDEVDAEGTMQAGTMDAICVSWGRVSGGGGEENERAYCYGVDSTPRQPIPRGWVLCSARKIVEEKLLLREDQRQAESQTRPRVNVAAAARNTTNMLEVPRME